MIALVLWLSIAAAKEPTCEPLDEVGFRDQLLQLQSGIDRGDLELSEAVVDEVHSRVPCFTFSPVPRQWAAYLVGESIVRFANGEDWEPVMNAALSIFPAVERGVSSRHPLATYEPPEATVSTTPAPKGSRIVVDGLPVTVLPDAGEVHLIQRTDGRFWNSWLTGPGEPLPDGWTAERVTQPPRIISWGGVGAGLGAGGVWQLPSYDSRWTQTIRPGKRRSVAGMGSVQAAATFYSSFGVYVRASLWTWASSPGIDAHVAGIWRFQGLMLGAGGGTASVDEFQGPRVGSPLAELLPEEVETHRIHMPRYALLTAHLRGGNAWRVHAGVTAGLGPALRRGLVELHVSPPEEQRPGRWRVGLVTEWIGGELAELQRPVNVLDVGSTRGGLQLSRVWGEY